jgi:rod shape-determining protein MreB
MSPLVRQSRKRAVRVLAIGAEAKKMLGRTPGNIVAIRPMKDGVIADFEIAEKMLNHFIKKAYNRNTFVRPVLSAFLLGSHAVEQRRSGLGRAGRGPRGVSDRGAGRGCDQGGSAHRGAFWEHGRGHRRGNHGCSGYLSAGIVYSESVKVAGDKMDDAIVNYIKEIIS